MTTEEFKQEFLSIYKDIKSQIKKVSFTLLCGFNEKEELGVYELEFNFLGKDDGNFEVILVGKFDNDMEALDFAEDIKEVVKPYLSSKIKIVDEVEYVSD